MGTKPTSGGREKATGKKRGNLSSGSSHAVKNNQSIMGVNESNGNKFSPVERGRGGALVGGSLVTHELRGGVRLTVRGAKQKSKEKKKSSIRKILN